MYIQSKRVCGMIKTHSSISDLLLWWKDVFSKFFFESVFKQPQKQAQEVKIHRKTPVQEPLFKESCRPASCNFLKKETLAHVFSYEFCEISKNTFFTEHLRCFCNLLNKTCFVKVLVNLRYKFLDIMEL